MDFLNSHIDPFAEEEKIWTLHVFSDFLPFLGAKKLISARHKNKQTSPLLLS
jgi:hypothetical protein